jgi:cation transport ATPase
MAIWTSLGEAARAHVLFRGGDVIEQLAGVRRILIDKTGTLTTGAPDVEELVVVRPVKEQDAISRALRLASASTHPYSQAIRRFAESGALGAGSFPPLQDARTLPGRGVRDEDTFLGNSAWMKELGLAIDPGLDRVIEAARDAGRSLSCIAWDGRVSGMFILREQVRPEAAEALAKLRLLGLDVTLLTGDHASRAADLGYRLGIHAIGNLLPEDKVAAVMKSQQATGPVAMVGDGLNDAPALAQSDVGIAMGCGADVARDSAAVCLLGNDLLQLPWAIHLAIRTRRVIQQNLFWAFFYNVLGIALAWTGWLNPMWAALAMGLSSFFVVANSLRLSRESRPERLPDAHRPAANQSTLQWARGNITP